MRQLAAVIQRDYGFQLLNVARYIEQNLAKLNNTSK